MPLTGAIRYVVLITSSLMGTYVTTRSISLYLGYFPSERNLFLWFFGSGRLEMTREFYFYLGGMAILAIAGMMVQMLLFRTMNLERDGNHLFLSLQKAAAYDQSIIPIDHEQSKKEPLIGNF